jgi:chromosome segregation protein
MFGGSKTTHIVLDKGLTVFTGPNGSGKTNIVDAILFGLGELSSRRLRAENFSKLIFHGSPDAGVTKAKTAKVVIQFDNSGSRIPVETNTVTISRELRKNGESVFRLNGRRVSRANLTDILSMAGISSSGYNVVAQGTITRMAEIAPSERRKVIEDLVGIGQYDAEKAEAEEKLRAAEISIRTAMGRIDEVQKRVDDLERERNELIRHTFIQNELKRFEAMKISHEIAEIKNEAIGLSSKIEEISKRIEKLRQLREGLRTQRHETEAKWSQLSSEVVEEGGTRVLEVQIKIGDLKSKLTEITTKIDAGKTSNEGLRKVRNNNIQQLDAIKNEISENTSRIHELERTHDQLANEIASKQAQHDTISEEASCLRANLGENSKKILETQEKLDDLNQDLNDLRNNYAKSQARLQTLSRRISDLNTRKEKFASTLDELKKSFKDLQGVKKEQENQLEALQHSLDKKVVQKEAVGREIVEADKIAKSAREAVVEFATQREIAEKIAREEKALRNIEELGELGVISGVHGRLRNLIRINRGYERAIEATASGWLDSIVVEDFDTAFTCTETLRRLKLGRIKIIPLQGLSNIKSVVAAPKIEEVGGAASAFVKYSERYSPAVTFVFGDTFITRHDKAALAASREGYRAATVNGDLYEPGGAIECGYYRAPIDFSSIIPSENAVQSLDQAVNALQEHLTRRESDVTTLGEDIDTTRVDIARLTEMTSTIEGEIARVQRNIKATKQNVKRIGKQILNIQGHREKERTEIVLQKTHRDAIRRELQKLRSELSALRQKVDLSRIQEMEIQRERLADEIIVSRQMLGSMETELATAKSKMTNILKIGADNIRIQLRKVEHQLSTIEKEVLEATQQKEDLEKELKELEKSKEELSRSVLSAREESKRFTSQIDYIDSRLKRYDEEHEKASQILNSLQLKVQTFQLQLDQDFRRLNELGYEKPMEISPEQLQIAKSSLKPMQLELERLGAVNQLAPLHYAEQISRYKELSLRMNELEKEKQAIISFMEEIERKKQKVFMEAFNRINENISKYFSKLTDGGEAALKLENTEEPFAGGIDMVVQFTGKPPILVSGASSGERSVSAVAFIFALQDFTPSTFYLFDEVDAHLDAFHVNRLGELVVEESAKSQFLVITLKPEMIQKAERVYGVYARNGVSNVISASFKESSKQIVQEAA